MWVQTGADVTEVWTVGHGGDFGEVSFQRFKGKDAHGFIAPGGLWDKAQRLGAQACQAAADHAHIEHVLFMLKFGGHLPSFAKIAVKD